MDHQPKLIEFKGRKPSKAQIVKRCAELADAGHTFLEVQWGENWFTLDKQGNAGNWYGMGHIKDIAADSIAAELNATDPARFLRNHFQIIYVRD
jgi:hypothetical protein